MEGGALLPATLPRAGLGEGGVDIDWFILCLTDNGYMVANII